MKTRFKRYFWDILVAADQLLNVLVGGYPDETLSARTHRKAKSGQWFWRLLRQVIDLMFRWQSANHCAEAWANEEARRHSPAELRDAHG